MRAGTKPLAIEAVGMRMPVEGHLQIERRQRHVWKALIGQQFGGSEVLSADIERLAARVAPCVAVIDDEARLDVVRGTTICVT